MKNIERLINICPFSIECPSNTDYGNEKCKDNYEDCKIYQRFIQEKNKMKKK